MRASAFPLLSLLLTATAFAGRDPADDPRGRVRDLGEVTPNGVFIGARYQWTQADPNASAITVQLWTHSSDNPEGANIAIVGAANEFSGSRSDARIASVANDPVLMCTRSVMLIDDLTVAQHFVDHAGTECADNFEIFDNMPEVLTRPVCRQRGRTRIFTALTPGNDRPTRLVVVDGDSLQPFGDFFAFPAFDTRGLRVAAGDFNGDRVDDIITAAGTGGGPHIRVFDGLTGGQFARVGRDSDRSVFIASGDLTGDRRADIIVGAGPGGGPRVRVFDGANAAMDMWRPLLEFDAYDAQFSGGVRVAVGDVTGDGTADIITGTGPGGGPHVRVFDGVTQAMLTSFEPFDAGFTGGVFVASGDVNGDGLADIITGAGPGTQGGHVKVFDGAEIDIAGIPPTELQSFFAYDPAFRGGVFVAAGDVSGDASADIITGAGAGGGPHIKVFDGASASLLREFMLPGEQTEDAPSVVLANADLLLCGDNES